MGKGCFGTMLMDTLSETNDFVFCELICAPMVGISALRVCVLGCRLMAGPIEPFPRNYHLVVDPVDN